MKSGNRILVGAVGAFLSAFALVPMAAHAVVVVGGADGWEISFDGNVNGFYVYSDRDPQPVPRPRDLVVDALSGDVVPAAPCTPHPPCLSPVSVTRNGVRAASTITDGSPGSAKGDKTSRVRTGLLPAFFSFNVRSPEVKGLTGSARISFAPQIQNANTKNNFGNGTQAGAQIDMREAFFNVDGGFGTLSVGRTLSLFQRHNILTDMTLFGVGAEGNSDAGGTTLGRIGYGYVYPQFNARISYRTPEVDGFQLEFGAYDPSKICGGNPLLDDPVCAAETDIPRWEAEATWATRFIGGNGGVKLFLSGMSQQAEGTYTIDSAPVRKEVEAHGVAGGLVLDYAGFELVGSGYIGEGLGTVLMLDTDSTDALGDERENHGYLAQASYTFFGTTKLGVSYGASTADETTDDTAKRRDPACGGPTTIPAGATRPRYVGEGTCSASYAVAIDENNSLTVGLYHDFTSWFKLVAEYTRSEVRWHDGAEQQADVYALGAFFLW